jgi:hypothetical protein
MNIFKKIFGKRKKTQNDECWYNNSHEKKRSRWSQPVESEVFNENFYDMAQSNKIAKD